MNAILNEFTKVRQDILSDKTEEQINQALQNKRKYKIINISTECGEITLNHALKVLMKHVSKLKKHYRITTAQLVNMLHTSQFYIATLRSVEMIWTLNEYGLLAFFRSRYDNLTLSKLIHQPDDYVENLRQLFSDQLHIDLTALSYVCLPVTIPELAHFERPYLLHRHIKSLFELVRTYYPNTSEYAVWEDSSVSFNSKLLARDLTPLNITVSLTSTGAISRIGLSEHQDLIPIYMEPVLDYRDIVNATVEFDASARKHLGLAKFVDIIGFPRPQIEYDTIASVLQSNLKTVPYVKDLVVPLLYRGHAALGIRTLVANSKPFFCVGLYPTSGIFSVRTIMSPDIVTLNNRTITSLYLAKEVLNVTK